MTFFDTGLTSCHFLQIYGRLTTLVWRVYYCASAWSTGTVHETWDTFKHWVRQFQSYCITTITQLQENYHHIHKLKQMKQIGPIR